MTYSIYTVITPERKEYENYRGRDCKDEDDSIPPRPRQERANGTEEAISYNTVCDVVSEWEGCQGILFSSAPDLQSVEVIADKNLTMI